MNGKGICPVCEQLVDCGELRFAEDCNVVVDDSLPRLKLTVRHPAVPGSPVTRVVSQQTGEVLETMCKGSHRPVKAVIVH